jgi:uncharacterized protein (DUF433 family)
MTDSQQITEEVPFHILDGAAKKIYDELAPHEWDRLTAEERGELRDGVNSALPMLRRYFTGQVEGGSTGAVVQELRRRQQRAEAAGTGNTNQWFAGNAYGLGEAIVLLTQQVEEEPRYTLEQARGEEAKRAVVDFLDAWRFCPVSRADSPARLCLEDAAGQLLAALTGALTQLPVGVGADPARPSSREARRAGGNPHVSADSDRERGEHCHSCGEAVADTCPTYWIADDDLWSEVEGGPNGIRCIRCFALDCQAAGIPIFWRACREPLPADSDGSHQPLGGDAHVCSAEDPREDERAGLQVAGGGSGQGAGSAPYETEVRIVSRPGVAGGAPMVPQGVGVRVVDLVGRIWAGENVKAVAADFDVDADSVVLLVAVAEAVSRESISELLAAIDAHQDNGDCLDHLLTERADRARENLEGLRKASLTQQPSDGQEGGVEEGADE